MRTGARVRVWLARDGRDLARVLENGALVCVFARGSRGLWIADYIFRCAVRIKGVANLDFWCVS